MDKEPDICQHTGKPYAYRKAALLGDGWEPIGEKECEAALAQKHRRISLITADAVEAAAHATMDYVTVDRHAFMKRMTCLSKAMWVHSLAERMRKGKAVETASLNAFWQAFLEKEAPRPKPAPPSTRRAPIAIAPDEPSFDKRVPEKRSVAKRAVEKQVAEKRVPPQPAPEASPRPHTRPTAHTPEPSAPRGQSPTPPASDDAFNRMILPSPAPQAAPKKSLRAQLSSSSANTRHRPQPDDAKQPPQSGDPP
ncbi:MAG: hypothetical protein AAFR29_07645 [Pseudomonadota bacterium]